MNLRAPAVKRQRGPMEDGEVTDASSERGDLNARAINSRPVVLYHAREYSVETMQLLLKNGADPNNASHDELPAMLEFMWMHKVAGLQILRNHSFNIKWTKTFDLDSSFYGHVVSSKLLKGREIPQCNALHIAAITGSLDCLKYLVKEGVLSNINVPAGLGYTWKKILEYLNSRCCGINALSDLQETPLDIPVQYAMPKYIIDYLAEISATPGSVKTMGIDTRITIKVLGGNDREDLVRIYGEKTLKSERLRVLRKAIETGDLSICKQLRALGCSMDSPLPDCCVPLECALRHGENALALWLIRHNEGE
ncbi:uncharacterized protein DSM5745_05933 [Aspergillus mulundensis]|uniref:Ankyrin repeat protein n=1 Tax=Aspergillus mulundensis TaxID=1810919 RepID=A0A3D8RZ19_9EURO|nr:hypothetical protein DSM5745_05933 [Aspergillus mulundensis]RDW79081.1 hypothetical protein DSM5745_05933 [Aspergillus mulundensis]